MELREFSTFTKVGLAYAIAYYTAHCIPVLIPLNDT